MPEYRIPLDPRNPGQFFACCGLLELSEMAAPGAEAAFEEAGTAFVLNTAAPLPPQGLMLGEQPSLDGAAYDATLEPLDILFSGHTLTLDWWLNDTHTGKSPLKTWGGPQTPRRVLGELLRLLDYSVPLGGLFDAAAYTTTRFGVDARSAWDALDVGYSPNELRQKDAITFPWVEVLAVVGLEGLRPTEQRRGRYRYSTWKSPLPLVAARAACAAPWPGLAARVFEFSIAIRGQGYKTFLFAEGVDHV
jgi:CRISPR-associated protein Csx14